MGLKTGLGIGLGIMLVFALSLQGCGRKGPLIMPVPEAHHAAQKSAIPANPVTPSGKQP